MLDPDSKELETLAIGAILAVKRCRIPKEKLEEELLVIGKAIATYMVECGYDNETTSRFCASIYQTFIEND